MTKHTSLPKILCLAGVLAASGSAQAVLLYHYDYETSLTANNGSGLNLLTTVGAPATFAGGPTGSAMYSDFWGGNSATTDHQVLSVASDVISFANFRIDFWVTTFGDDSLAYDDFLSIKHSGHGATGSVGVQYVVPGHATAPNGIAFRGVGGGFSPAVNDSAWHYVVITGSASATPGAADLAISLDGVQFAGNTVAGGASHTLDIIQISGRPDGANNRFVFAGYDDIKIYNTSTVPEPSSATLLGLGGLALTLRRRKG